MASGARCGGRPKRSSTCPRRHRRGARTSRKAVGGRRWDWRSVRRAARLSKGLRGIGYEDPESCTSINECINVVDWFVSYVSLFLNYTFLDSLLDGHGTYLDDMGKRK